MSEQMIETEAPGKEPLISRLNNQINEERLLKDISAIQLNKLKALDALAHEMKESEKLDELKVLLSENLNEAPESLVSRYLIGTIALLEGKQDDAGHLRSLLEAYREYAKWTIVDYISDRILENDPDNRFALRAKVDSTERLRGKKEVGPFLERLASVDRKNPDVAKKYALSILDENPKRAVQFLKQAGETYAKTKDYRDLEDVWNLLIVHDYKDLPYFEKIERILVGNREKTRVAAFFVSLLEPFRVEEDWISIINILKKILDYEPASARARSELVRAYRARYANHSLLDDFLKMSDLTNNKKPVGPCIASFERNIVFDRGNYVYHRTRGVGKIDSIDNDCMVIDFHNNPQQKMSIQMAITSLKPLEPDHIWVRYYENPKEIEEIFKEDPALFFEVLLSSFSYKMVLGEIKAEICGRFLEPSEWSKWWSRVRTKLKKDSRFGFNPRKKDEIILRENPMTLSEEMLQKFQTLTDWNKKLELAFETLKDIDTEGATELCVQFYKEQEDSKDLVKKLHSYFFLKNAAEFIGEDEVTRKLTEEDIGKLFQSLTPDALVKLCAESTIVELKRDLVDQIIHTRSDYADVLRRVLFEVPIKVNKYVLTELNRLGKMEALELFLSEAIAKFKENPEIFLWVARSILQEQWNYKWINVSREEILLRVFRLLKPLFRLETKGTKLKNMAIETIFGTTNITVESAKNSILPDILAEADENVIRRMYALFRDVPFVHDAHKENFFTLIQEIRPSFVFESDFSGEEGEEEEEMESIESLFPGENVILVSQEGFDKRRLYLDHLINVELSDNSREIGIAQEKGDLRENAEYKAAMEKQSQLQAEIKTVDDELKRALVIEPSSVRTDMVSIGTKVSVKDEKGSKLTYTVLGPWEADSERNIISYRSPLGFSLIGKKIGDIAAPSSGSKVEILGIEKAL